MALPEFWRTEVWHPLSVHFPISLLLVATLFKLVSLKSKNPVWKQGGSILLYLGAVGAWLAVYTGDLADGSVSRSICDPTVLKDHENSAYTMSWLFSVAALLDVVLWLGYFASKKILLQSIIILLLFTGSGFLVYVGHLGASLVYEQGAGVHKPAPDCAEFE